MKTTTSLKKWISQKKFEQATEKKNKKIMYKKKENIKIPWNV